jgi:hypothetical protein
MYISYVKNRAQYITGVSRWVGYMVLVPEIYCYKLGGKKPEFGKRDK